MEGVFCFWFEKILWCDITVKTVLNVSCFENRKHRREKENFNKRSNLVTAGLKIDYRDTSLNYRELTYWKNYGIQEVRIWTFLLVDFKDNKLLKFCHVIALLLSWLNLQNFWLTLLFSDLSSTGVDPSYWWKQGTKDASFFCLVRFKERWEVPSS